MMTRDLDSLIAQWEADPPLFEPDQLRQRMEVLDELDAHFGDADGPASTIARDPASIVERAHTLRGRLESANETIYQSIRNQIQQSDPPSELLRWIRICSDQHGTPAPGLGYDHLDELINGVLQLREPDNVHQLEPEMVFYQPTPARHILRLIQLSGLSESDMLIDLGSGLGHVPILASILTGARSLGVEAEHAYVASARDCARDLHLSSVGFIQQNAIDSDLSAGTVFHLYTPFTGNTLSSVLKKLQKESAHRSITICTLGPCTLAAAREHWLAASSYPDPDQIMVFRSNKPRVPHP
jgi:Histone methylation protein DOT1